MVAVAATVPIGILAITFPEGGRFPFLFGDFVLTAGIAAFAAWLLPSRYRTLRLGSGLYALAAVPVFLVPNALGGNFSRLAVYTAAPLAAGLLWPARRVLAVLVVGALALWQWQPAFDGMTAARSDPSLKPGYYAGLLSVVDALPRPVSRSRSPVVIGRPPGSRPTWRSPADGNANSTSPSTRCSTHRR